MQLLDVAPPLIGAPMHDLGHEVDQRRPEIEELLALEIEAPTAARDVRASIAARWAGSTDFGP
jgi:hypothetical protein